MRDKSCAGRCGGYAEPGQLNQEQEETERTEPGIPLCRVQTSPSVSPFSASPPGREITGFDPLPPLCFLGSLLFNAGFRLKAGRIWAAGFGLAPRRGRGQDEIGCGAAGAGCNDVAKGRGTSRQGCGGIAGDQAAGQPWMKLTICDYVGLTRS